MGVATSSNSVLSVKDTQGKLWLLSSAQSEQSLSVAETRITRDFLVFFPEMTIYCTAQGCLSQTFQ